MWEEEEGKGGSRQSEAFVSQGEPEPGGQPG